MANFSKFAGLLIVALLTGCASGVRMNDDERAACHAEGCIVLTEKEARALVAKALSLGYVRGWRDATRQSGEAL